MLIIKRDGTAEEFNWDKIDSVITKAFHAVDVHLNEDILSDIKDQLYIKPLMNVEDIQNQIEDALFECGYQVVGKAFLRYRDEHNRIREEVNKKKSFINTYKSTSNNADSTIDDNSNVSNKNIGAMNAEIHKSDNVIISRGMLTDKLAELFPASDIYKQYKKDLEAHIIYKHDESSFCGPIAPYCVSVSMYPFLIDGLKKLGGQSTKPTNLDSYCGMYINLIFAISSLFAGAVATPEFLVYFDYFAKKEWGDDYYLRLDEVITAPSAKRQKTIRYQIQQYFQQVVHSINQPSAARGLQSAFVNHAMFDEQFFHGMFDNFVFPDCETKPTWESVNTLQHLFMKWFNKERLSTILTFPVVSYALVYKDGKFLDEDTARFVAEEYSQGNSFFTYISDTVDSLSSCCFSKDQKILWKSSTEGVKLTTLEELYSLKWEPYKKNLRIFHNGSWVKGNPIKLPNRSMYKVTTFNNKEFYMTDNHINVTLDGEKPTSELTLDDYLMFNTQVLSAIPENDEHLTYAQGFAVGAFLGDGSFGAAIDGVIYDINYSQNKDKYLETITYVNLANRQLGGESVCKVNEIYNNVYPIRISSKTLAAFIMKWTCWERGTYAHNKKLNLNCLLQSIEFRKGILDGWYNTDGGNSNRCYTTSPELADNMETLITSLGMNSIINVSDRTNEKVIIRDQEYNRNYPLYCVRWYSDGNHRTNKDQEKSWIKKNNSIYFKIKTIEKVEYNDDVYCIECTDKNEPYFTLPSGLITHNCRLKNKLQTKEFNFTNGNMGIETGSKSVITLNLSRIIQLWASKEGKNNNFINFDSLKKYLEEILERVYQYHIAYNECLWDMYDAGLLPVYKAGFIHLDKQYLTIGLNGLNQAAEFLGITCNDNEKYKQFCQFIFSTIKDYNTLHSTKFNGHKLTFNTEQVPAESLAVKNYNWDKSDGFWVPEDTNLYASYIFKPNDKSISVLEKLKLHGSDYIGDYLDGGAACHINLDSHLSFNQCYKILEYSAKVGCQYFTFNVPNCQCEDCGFIAKQPFEVCPKCGSKNVSLWDRIIGYLTKIKNWSKGRQIEQTTRVYHKLDNIE